ncbi:MAG: hypothetical protein NVS2B9_21350 [Myxococcales bacterium]
MQGEKCEESWTGAVRCLGPDGLAVQRSSSASRKEPASGLVPIVAPVGGGTSAPSDARLPAEGDAVPPR